MKKVQMIERCPRIKGGVHVFEDSVKFGNLTKPRNQYQYKIPYLLENQFRLLIM